jgi:hypothetical protein
MNNPHSTGASVPDAADSRKADRMGAFVSMFSGLWEIIYAFIEPSINAE